MLAVVFVVARTLYSILLLFLIFSSIAFQFLHNSFFQFLNISRAIEFRHHEHNDQNDLMNVDGVGDANSYKKIKSLVKMNEK